MSKVYVKKKHYNKKKLKKIIGALCIVVGLTTAAYIFAPLVLFEIYLAPAFAEQSIQAPIPQTTVVNTATISNLIASTNSPIMGTNYDDANNWFPNLQKVRAESNEVKEYSIQIPAIHITDAIVSTQDTDLSKHLVQYGGTSVPPNTGNAIIFGHSTIPWWFDPNNYHTIFANAQLLRVGDKITAVVNGNSYTYDIISTTVIDPSDTSMLTQEYNGSYLTLVTCTPPGTTWKRLIIRSKLESM